FDEQLWPINALLVVLCALSAGVIIGTSEFTHELNWSNGWLRLATLVFSVALLMALAWRFRGKIGHRFQLGAMASLLVHALVAILLSWQYLSLLQDNRETARHDTPPVLVQYEYHVRAPDERAPREAHERPVETETPEDRPIELSRTAPTEPQIEQPRPQPLPETQPTVEPTELQMKRNEFAAPKRAEEESRLSRSTTQTPAQPSEQISAPEQQAAAEPATQPVESRATAVARSETRPTVPSSTAETPTTVQVTRAAAQPARRMVEVTNQPTPSEAASATRAIAQATATPAPAVDAPTGVTASAASPASSALTGPAQTEMERTASAAPPRATPTLTAAPAPSVPSVTQTATPRRETASAPSLAAAAQPADSPPRAATTALSPASPVNLQSPALAAVSSAQDAPALQQPAATSISRSTTGTTGVGESPNFDRGLAGPASEVTVASAASQRAASSLDTGPAPAASAPSPVRRSRAQATIDSTTALAQDTAPADYRGGPTVTELEATSSAALSRSASTAPSASIAAAAGNLPADTGAPQVVSRGGLSRSDGGGQPTVAAVANVGQPTRSAATGQSIAATASNVVAPAPVAPASDGDVSTGAPSLAQDDTGRRAIPTATVGTSPAQVGTATIAGTETAVASAARVSVPTTGGGPSAANASSAAPSRSTTSAFAADDTVQLAASPQSANPNDGTPLETSVTGIQRSSVGLPGSTSLAAVGGSLFDTPAAGPASAGSVADRPAAQAPGVDGPQLNRGAPLARSSTTAIPAAAGEALEVPELASDAPAAARTTAGDEQPGPSTGPSELARRSSRGVPVQVASIAGPGGLAVELSAVVGSRKMAAQRESDLIHNTETRFLGREITGAVPAPSFIREAAKAFERRGRDNGAGEGQQGTKTEEAIERGLEYLARSQQEDGSWSFQKFAGATADDAGSIHSDTAATGLALMAFLGGGYDHFEDKHRDTVRRGLHFLLRRQKETGDLYEAQDAVSHGSAWLYSHAIASIALCEALGMTGDAELRGPAQRALDFIEASQDRQYGGWRYKPGDGSDTSVAGWQLMALKSGELAGLRIKPETYEAVRKWLDRAQDGSRYLYNPTQPNTQYPTDQRRPTMTSVGLLMRLYLGWDRTRPEFQQGADHISDYPAAYGTSSDPKRDTYYWYYATQVMFHMGDKYWEQWRTTLHPLLVNGQVMQGPLAGSWHPNGNIPDRWGPHGGRIYVTTLNLLSLEVRYRHLPIYEETGK
ncbi:MAG: hypothetical protein WD894_04445, partial [Pirellulales bacterium]